MVKTVPTDKHKFTEKAMHVALHDSVGNPLTGISDHVAGYGLFCITEPIGYQISEGGIAGHESYHSFGYDAGIGATLKDINGYATNTPVPATAITMQTISSSANDAGTLITSGTSTGGSTTTLIDTGKNFVTLGILAGDFVLNDTDVSLGTVVTIDSATQLTIQPTSTTSYALKVYRIARAASTGAAILEHHGLDSAWAENSEFIISNGLVAVPTVKQYIRSNNFHCMGAGSNAAPVGNISLRDNATGTITYNYIGLGLNMSLQAHYTVPVGKVMFVVSWSADPSSNKPMRSFLRATADFHDRAKIPVFHVQDVMVVAKQHKFDLPLRFPEKCDVKISSQIIGVGNGEAGGAFEFWIEDAH